MKFAKPISAVLGALLLAAARPPMPTFSTSTTAPVE